MTYLLASAARATIGARSGQEDAYRVWPAEGTMRPVGQAGLLAVLADGMGGHRGGAIAGQTACATFTESFAAADMPFTERLSMALHSSNDALAEGVERNSGLKGMGCTLIGAWFDDTGVRWTSVGDSLLLLYRFPDVIRLNEDHSLGSYLDEQARRNEISFEEARANRHRNALRSALTGSKIDLIDLRGEPLQLMAGDWIILASDGISSLDGDEMADVMFRFRSSPPDEMAEGLIAAVEHKQVPEQDNTTVVAVRIEGASESVMRRPAAEAQQEDVTLRTRRIGVVSGRKVGGVRAAAPEPPGSTVGTLVSKGPVALLLAAGAAFVVAAAFFLFTNFQKVNQLPVPDRPTPALKSFEKIDPSPIKQRSSLPPTEPEERAPKVDVQPPPPPLVRPPAEPTVPAVPSPAPPPSAAPGPGPRTGPGPSQTPEAVPPSRGPGDLQKKRGGQTEAAPPDSTISEPAGPGGQPADPGIAPPSAVPPTPTPQQGGSPPRNSTGPRKIDKIISGPREEKGPPVFNKVRPRERAPEREKEEVPRTTIIP